MSLEAGRSPGFWATVWLLLAAARKRSSGRRKRQQELLSHRNKKAMDWGPLSFILSLLFMAVLHVFAAFVLRIAVSSAEHLQAERTGRIVVSGRFLEESKALQESGYISIIDVNRECSREAGRIAEKYGGNRHEIEQRLSNAFRAHGTQDFIAEADAAPGMSAVATAGPFPAMLGSLVLLFWGVMLVCQGEGLELDLQRRRHPMWEWLFSHPVPPSAVFLSEMLSPIAANPAYWGAPLFVGCVYGFVYGPVSGFLAAILIGIPLSVAAASLGKALEIGIVLRFPSRSRGAMIGLMSWFGYVSMMLFLFGMAVVPKVVTALGWLAAPFTILPWPWLKFFLGAHSDGSLSFIAGLLTCWTAAGLATAGGIWFSIWGANQGLSGNTASADRPSRAKRKSATKFGKDPLYRKEFLWFVRDRSAIVQAVLIPLSVAGFQLFNMRGILGNVQSAWNYLCGAAIMFGTYFLWVLGPKSLASEGTALWIALTWPRGLENLLKAKAWLWSLISSALVMIVLAYTAFLFPTNIGQVALVGIGWFFFSRSMAEKSVTLVTVTSSSGESQPVPRGHRWAAQLGMFTFSIGVLTQHWNLAVVGIVYSYLTAAAMWENFRARLPYLYDPWSEKVPPAPTLMHAMVAISILVEVGAVLTGILSFGLGPENIVVAQAMSYGICATIVSILVANFLKDRGVSLRDVWSWQAGKDHQDAEPWWSIFQKPTFVLMLLTGAGIGVALGLFAHGYLAVLQHFPAAAEIIRKGREQMANLPGARNSYAIVAVGFAPLAEEYLFRGLLYRALDREWGGWRAVVGSAAFFAIYHPPLSWVPVALLGVANAILFKRTGRLAPAVVLHMVYNAVVLM